MIELETCHGPIDGHLSPPKKGSVPGVLVLHAWWGLSGIFRSVCDRLATVGFTTFAPDLYHGAVASTIDEADKLSSELEQKAAMRDLVASVEGLRAYPAVTGSHPGVVGFSLGAHLALALAQERPSDTGAVVVFYRTGGGNHGKTQAGRGPSGGPPSGGSPPHPVD